MTKGSWYWVAGKGPMQYIETRPEEADPLVMYMPKGTPCRTKPAYCGTEPMTVDDLNTYRKQCAEKQIDLPPVAEWGSATVDALLSELRGEKP